MDIDNKHSARADVVLLLCNFRKLEKSKKITEVNNCTAE